MSDSARELIDAIMEHVDRNGELDPGEKLVAISIVEKHFASRDRALRELVERWKATRGAGEIVPDYWDCADELLALLDSRGTK